MSTSDFLLKRKWCEKLISLGTLKTDGVKSQQGQEFLIANVNCVN